MSSSQNKNSMFIVFTGILIAIARFMLGGIDTKLDDEQHILIIMAGVNYVALGFVLLFLYNDFCGKCREKINRVGISTTLKKTCNSVILIISVFLLIVYLGLGILYMLVLKTSDLNDVISIIALAISIAANGLVEDYKDGFYKLVLKMGKGLFNFKEKRKLKKDVTE